MPHDLLQDPGLPVPNPTRSYWQQPPAPSLLKIQSPVLPKERDVVVIGSGITGCSVTWWLLQDSSSLSVSVLDAREICSGATGRNGGRVNCTAVRDFDKYSKLFGRETARLIVRFELAHFDVIKELVASLGPEIYERSELRWIDAVLAVFEDEELARLECMLEAFEEAFPDLKGRWKIVGREEVVSKYRLSNARGALVGKAGAAWPYRMITSIFKYLTSQYSERLSLEPDTPALSVARASSGAFPYRIDTPRGVIYARHVVHCTEGHVAHLLPRLRGILVPRRGQMTVQNPGTGFPDGGSRSWSFNIQGGLDYATSHPQSGVIFIGGGEGSEKQNLLGISSDAGEDIKALAHLGGVLPAAFGLSRWGHERPGKRRVEASWSGIMCNSIDHVPLVGIIPQELLERPAGDCEAGEWISAGYGGYGMVNAFLSGKAVAKMIAGEDVGTWLPKVYLLSAERAKALQLRLRKASKSRQDHLRALL